MHVWGHACVAVICCAFACGRYSVTLSMRCFRLLSSMCRTSEIDGRLVHLRGSDRCEISYAATLTRSMCRSTFEDPIDVNFIIIMLLYSCTRITPRVCTLVLFIYVYIILCIFIIFIADTRTCASVILVAFGASNDSVASERSIMHCCIYVVKPTVKKVFPCHDEPVTHL